MTVRLIACPFCKNFQAIDNAVGAVCSAFPQGIPDEIKYGEAFHTEPWPGDNGVRFDPIAGYEQLVETFEEIDQERIRNEPSPIQ